MALPWGLRLFWGLGLFGASSCLGSGSGSDAQHPASAPRQRAGNAPRAPSQVSGGAARKPWDKGTCSWPVVPRLFRDDQPIALEEATMGSEGFPTHLQIVLEFDGEDFFLDLVQNWELLATTRGLIYYLPNGTRTTHRTGSEGNCCYWGRVERHLDSWASICICSGLSGLIVLSGDQSYTLESSSKGTRAYRLEGARQDAGECRTSSQPHLQPFLRPKSEQLLRVRRDSEPELGYVELVIVADPTEFGLDPDLERFRLRMLEIASHMDGFYRNLGLRVALVGIEIWNTTDHPATVGPPQVLLERLLQWRQDDLLRRIPHDNVQLIVGTPFAGETVGAATHGSICSGRSGGVNLDHSVSPLIMASTLSHQLGHNLGLDHDGASCGCDSTNPNLSPGRGCIMEPPKGIMPGLRFSSCSRQQLDQIFKSRKPWCLLDVPQPQRMPEALCGNHLVEFDEECDCGLREECTDPCCNVTTCRLKPGAECATGEPCCYKCKLRAPGSVCREAQNECDLPEYCNGTSPYCPGNFYKQDGTPCGQDKAVCYGGVCPTYLSQCQELWGPGSRPVSESCVDSLNSRGDLDGHCGQRPDGSYVPCAKKDVLCGRLQCQDVGTSAGQQNQTTRAPICPHRSPTPVPDVLDLAMALPGTVCGSGQVCIDQRCQNLSLLKLPDCQCGGHGVCNSKGHCHCQLGWAPPDCLQKGAGGSVDSGPMAVEQAGNATSTALLLTALLVLAAAGLGFFAKRIGLHKRLCQFGKGTSCQYSAEPESRVGFLHPAEEGGITQPEPRSYSRAPPERPQPPQWRQRTEFQFMQNSKPAPPGTTRPDPPSKPLPPDPTPKGQQALPPDRPAPPTRPLPADPIPKDSQPPVPAKPPPPRKPLPSDPPRAELWAVPNYDLRAQMLPSRPAPSPPRSASPSMPLSEV